MAYWFSTGQNIPSKRDKYQNIENKRLTVKDKNPDRWDPGFSNFCVYSSKPSEINRQLVFAFVSLV